MEEYDINEIREEFLQNVAQQYLTTYGQQAANIGFYMLQDFCNNISANDLVLVRYNPAQLDLPPIPPQPQPIDPRYSMPQQPQYARQIQQQRPIPQMQPMQQQYSLPPQRFAQPPQPLQEDPFNQYQDINKQVSELNNNLRARQPIQQPRQQPAQEINLEDEKPKTFINRIKDMRAPRKVDKINPED